MKKKTEREKNIDHDLWEDFVLKNNIKKNSSGRGVKLNVQTNKMPIVREVKEVPTYLDRRVEPVLKNTNIKSFIELSSPKIGIDIEKNKLRRIKSGKISIERKIDLHGLSLKESEKKLKIFVDDSLRLKKRFLLVITGKGKNSKPNIHGEIKTINSEITRWLSDRFYHDKVQYISKALDKHGGTGAYYLFLKKL